MEKDLVELMVIANQKKELATIMESNSYTQEFGITLTEDDARLMVIGKNESLKQYQRVELGESMLKKIIFTFCDSQYVDNNNFKDIMIELQDVFYLFKNESDDQLTDDELLIFMKEQFETICMGDVDYLSGTCLERFSRAIRSGYMDYQETEGSGVYEHFDEEQRWDKDLYMEVVSELFW